MTRPSTIQCWRKLPYTLSCWTAEALNSVQKTQKLRERRSRLTMKQVHPFHFNKLMTGYDIIPYKEKSVMGEMAVPQLILNLNMFEVSSERKSRLVRYPPYAWGRRKQSCMNMMLNDTVMHHMLQFHQQRIMLNIKMNSEWDQNSTYGLNIWSLFWKHLISSVCY